MNSFKYPFEEEDGQYALFSPREMITLHRLYITEEIRSFEPLDLDRYFDEVKAYEACLKYPKYSSNKTSYKNH